MHKKKIYYRLTGVACFLIGVLAIIFSLFLMPIGGGRAQTLTTAIFLPGDTFNKTIKSLATGATVTSINDVDTLIQQVVRTGNAQIGVTTGLLSTNNSEVPVVGWFDNGVLYYYTEAEVIYLNQDSSNMFRNIQSGTYIDTSGWDTSSVTNISSMFNGCSSLTSLDVSNWNTSNVSYMYNMFWGCSSLMSLDVSEWDTSSVTTMDSMFNGCSSLMSLDVSEWDTSSVTNMVGMFWGCSSLTELDVSNWDTSKVTNMFQMFNGCSSLTGLDVSEWDTSSVTNMRSMFNNCSSLTSLDVSHFDTSKVTNMQRMFGGCSNIKIIYASTGFITSGVTSSTNMFSNTSKLVGGHGTKWNSSYTDKTRAVLDSETQSGYLTYDIAVSYRTRSGVELARQVINVGDTTVAPTITGYNILGYYADTGLTTPFNLSQELRKYTEVYVDYECATGYKLEDGLCKKPLTATFLPGSTFNTTIKSLATGATVTNDKVADTLIQQVLRTGNVPAGVTTGLLSTDDSEVPVIGWFDNGVLYYYTEAGVIYLNQNSSLMFYYLDKATYIDTSGWDASNVINMGSMFNKCLSLTELDVSNFDTSRVTDMSLMFYICKSLTGLDVSEWDTSSVTNMRSMFNGCRSLTGLDVSNFDTSNVTDMSEMFYYCDNLIELDVSNWNTNKVVNMKRMFDGCSNLNTIYASTGFITSGVTNSSSMFGSTPKLIGGHGTKSPSLGDSKSGAVLDSESASGYLTYDIAVSYRTRRGVELARQVINVGDTTVAPSITGYNVVGYYTNSGLTTPFNFSQELRTYTEVYVDLEEIFEATFEENGADTIGSYTLTGGTIIMPNIIRDGREILGRSTDSGATEAEYLIGETIVLSGNVTFYAITKRTYTATFYPNGADSIGRDTWLCEMYNSNMNCENIDYSSGVQYSTEVVHTIGADNVGLLTICNPNNTGECLTMMDKNLGASSLGTTTNNSASYGNLYQWGNNYGFSTSGTPSNTSVQVDTHQYGPSQYNSSIFIYGNGDWSSMRNDDLWGGVTNTYEAMKGPCPEGYHVPSWQEWENVVTWRRAKHSYSKSALANAFYLPFAGYRGYNSVNYTWDNNPNYWSSTTSGEFARALSFYQAGPSFRSTYRGYAYAVRCFKNPIKSINIPVAPSIIRSGWNIIGWSSDQDATTGEYAVGDELIFTGDMVLYAITKKEIVVNYELNGADAVSTGYDSCVFYNNNTGCRLILPTITRDGWEILGRSTNPNATIGEYLVGQEISFMGNTTLYAITSKEVSATFKPNGNLLDGGNTDIVKSCMLYNTNNTCQVTTPSISNIVTPEIVGYSLSSVGTTDVDIGSNTVANIAGGEIYYAQTAKYAEHTATFLGDGTSHDEVCNSAVFNGDTTPISCTVVAPGAIQSSNVSYYTVDGMPVITVCGELDLDQGGTSTKGAVSHESNETCITIMDRNLGATTDDIDDEGSYGYYYQWGNNYGFPSTGNIVTGDQEVDCTPYGVNNQYMSGVFIVGNYNRCQSQKVNYNMWGGGDDGNWNNYGYPVVNPTDRQGPCPEGYHVPSHGEWGALVSIRAGISSVSDFWNIYLDDSSQMQESLKIPLAGFRRLIDASVFGVGEEAKLLSSSSIDGYGIEAGHLELRFDPDSDELWGSVNGGGLTIADGASVRCFKNTAFTGGDDKDTILGRSNTSGATTPDYVEGDVIGLTGDKILYAVIKDIFKATYDANGGEFPAQPGFVTHYEGDIIYTGTNGEIFTGIGTITITTGDRTITMLDRNLGARVAGTGCIYPTETVTTKASSSDYTCMGDNDVYGYHFQWGNNHGFIPCTGEQGCTDFPGGETISNDTVDISDYSWQNPYSSGVFVIRNNDWLMGSNVNLRGGIGDTLGDNIGINNNRRQGPCPEGFHVPSAAEWHEVDDLRCNGEGIMNKCEYNYTEKLVQLNKNISLAGTSNNPIGGVVHDFENDFLIPYAGHRDYNNGDVGYVGKDAYFWTSSSPNCAVGGKASICTNFYSYHLGYQDKKYDPRNNVDRNLSEAYDIAKGYSVRCFSDEYAVYDTGARIIGIDYTQVEVRYIYNDNEDEYMALDTYREPVRSGYIFDGWCADTGCNIPFENSGIENGMIVYAKWICPVGYMDNGDECVPSDDTPYQVKHYVKDAGLMAYSLYDTQDFSGTTNDLLLLSGYARDDIPCAEYMSGSLTGDTTGPGQIVQSTTILPDGSTVIYLYYKRRVYEVDLQKDMFTNMVEGAGTYECGQEVQIRAYPIDGYHFDMWEGSVDD